MHSHDHTPITVPDEAPGYYEVMETAIRELLAEKRMVQPAEIRRQLEVLDSRNPELGAKIVARAWVDAEFRKRILANGRTACEELGIDFYDDTGLIVLENTETVHNLIVCTLCSCYPRPVLGWYKQKPYRARAVREPRAVLAELGTAIPEDIEVRVSDSTSAVRFLVLPLRPVGTENWSEEELASLVTRDTMIGVSTIEPQDRRVQLSAQSENVLIVPSRNVLLTRSVWRGGFRDTSHDATGARPAGRV